MDNESIAVKISEHENRIKVQEHRMADVEEAIKLQSELVINVHRLADGMAQMLTEQQKQGARLSALEDKPREMWDATRKAFFNAFLGAMGAAVAGSVIWFISYIITKGAM